MDFSKKTYCLADLTEEVLRREYLVEGLSTRKIAKKYQCNNNTVRKRIYLFNIPVTKKQPSTKPKKVSEKVECRFSDFSRKKGYDSLPDFLRKEYVDNKVSLRGLCDLLGIPQSSHGRLRYFLDKYGIQPRSRWQSKKKDIDTNRIHRMRYIEGMSIRRIAEILSVSVEKIQLYVTKHKIPPPEKETLFKVSKEDLYREYVVHKKTVKECAKYFGVGLSSVFKYLEVYGVLRRQKDEAQKSRRRGKNSGQYKNKQWLHSKYVDEKMSSTEIAILCGCGKTTIMRWLVKHKIPMRTSGETMTGEKSPRFGKPPPWGVGTKRHWCTYIDKSGIEHKFQSSWEKKFAEYLDSKNIVWLSHPNVQRFRYKDIEGKVKTYGPDFFLPEKNVFIEVKGYFPKEARYKMIQVKAAFPDTKILIIRKRHLKMLGIDIRKRN